MSDGPQVIKLKRKYTEPKTAGRHKAGGGGSTTKGTKRRKVGGGPSPVETVMVLGRWHDVVAADGTVSQELRFGKVSFITRERLTSRKG